MKQQSSGACPAYIYFMPLIKTLSCSVCLKDLNMVVVELTC